MAAHRPPSLPRIDGRVEISQVEQQTATPRRSEGAELSGPDELPQGRATDLQERLGVLGSDHARWQSKPTL
jgi:hypothetical protein